MAGDKHRETLRVDSTAPFLSRIYAPAIVCSVSLPIEKLNDRVLIQVKSRILE